MELYASDLAAAVRHHQDVSAWLCYRLAAGGSVRHAGFLQYYPQPCGRQRHAFDPQYHPHPATLVTALIATYVFGLGTLAGTTAIAVFTFAYIGKILYEEIETVDMGAFEAMEAMGSTKVRAFISSIVPQVLPSYLSNCLFCFEGNVRYASILGYVGAGGLGLILNEKIGWREYSSVGMILLALFVTVFIIESISRAARKRLV